MAATATAHAAPPQGALNLDDEAEWETAAPACLGPEQVGRDLVRARSVTVEDFLNGEAGGPPEKQAHSLLPGGLRTGQSVACTQGL